MEEIKKTEIEKQNVLLFNKMMKIMKKGGDGLPSSYSATNNLTAYSSSNKNYVVKNNRLANENSRITEENKCMFERL